MNQGLRLTRYFVGVFLLLPMIFGLGVVVGQTQEPGTVPVEESVNPGINKTFVNPELDVEAFVKRFEVESREIYVARNEILEACGIKPGEVIGDVGAGTGLFSELFAKKTGTKGWVYAVDISPRFLTHINQQAISNGTSNITSVLCMENSINLPPNSCDLIFICDTYHHFEFPKSTLATVRRALKEGGRLVVVDFNRIPGTTRPWLLKHVRAGKEVFRAEIQDAGFDFSGEESVKGIQENYFLQFKKN